MREGNHPSYHPNAKRTLSGSAHGDADAQFLVALMPQGWSHLAPACSRTPARQSATTAGQPSDQSLDLPTGRCSAGLWDTPVIQNWRVQNCNQWFPYKTYSFEPLEVETLT